jgi:hypothetical protein
VQVIVFVVYDSVCKCILIIVPSAGATMGHLA